MVKPSPVLDGLRGTASIVILVLHFLVGLEREYIIPHAGLAVDFFFMLSGYCITSYYAAQASSQVSGRKLFLVRAANYYPAILLGLALGFSVYLLKVSMLAESVNWIVVAINLALSVFLVPSPFALTDTWDFIYPFNGVTWSIMAELSMVFLFGAFFVNMRKSLLVILVIAGAAAATYQCFVFGAVTGGMNWSHIGDHSHHYMATVAGFSLPLPVFIPLALVRAFFPFFCGVLIYRCFSCRLGVGGIYAVIPHFLLAAVLLTSLPVSRWIYESIAITIIFPIILMWGSLAHAGDRYTRICHWLGNIAYPLYLTHYPLVIVFSYLIRKSGDRVPLSLWIAVEFVVCVAFARLVFLVVDNRFRRKVLPRFASAVD
ncbi:acyltransferase family protein [Pigmentiphaga litoralis]|uniref:Peptidoglycan/LPS O-acetylase OafA/YrhL n=1 Tax=Pigmentiphaga litoralis TaxID=516702 RepID=A0A7Y9ISG9_9BURK|nr:acyltransferase [Pigmentiphaga litoralis]NYE24240.1 peptidoglycan/LPS O-acetylase OafA/YrhL [Pigmentiphaga litoralis]NYE82146.1 peptidoglycan/LPS O-acetylase OafA/YrhL [Pigmentiphaga litoralis]